MTLLLMMGNIDQQTHGTLEFQAELGGVGNGWINIAADLMLTPALSIDYGISGAGPTDLVASTGRMSFALNNGQGNSANLLGYYSPDHTNCRSGWALGIGIRLVYRLGGVTYYKFSGTLDTVDPISGKYGERKVLCTAVDWMDEAAIYKPNVATQLSKRVDEIATTLVAAVPRQPRATSFGTGDSTFTYALDTDLNEADPVLTVLQRLAQSENGRFYIKGDTNTGGVLTFESRTARYVPSSVATFNDTMISLSAPRDRSLVVNRVKATTHPRTVDAAATTVLFSLAQASPTSIHAIAGGQTITIEGDYTDAANRSARVGGTEMVTPVATTDYTANTSATGGGTDLTASLVVEAQYGSNRVKYSIRNASGSAGFITKLQARGKGLYDYTPVDNIATDSVSIANYGERQLALDMPYESSSSTASEVGDYILGVWSNPSAVAAAMPLIPPTNTDLATMIAREPGQAITITETVTGISSIYFINHVSMSFETLGLTNGDIINFEWTLQKALLIPLVRTRAQSVVSVDNTNHTMNLPSGITAGELLIGAFTVDCQPAFAAPTVTWPAGWTVFSTKVFDLVGFVVGYTELAWRKADGTEGSTITVTTSVAQTSSHICYRIAGAADPTVTPPVAATGSNNDFPAGATTMEPPLLTPATGTANYLWLAIVGFYNPSPDAFTANFSEIPPNYSNPIAQTAAVGVSVGGADRKRRGSSENPGPFRIPTVTGIYNGTVYGSFTVAVYPGSL